MLQTRCDYFLEVLDNSLACGSWLPVDNVGNFGLQCCYGCWMIDINIVLQETPKIVVWWVEIGAVWIPDIGVFIGDQLTCYVVKF